MPVSMEAGVQIYSSSTHTHQGFRLEAENQREVEMLQTLAQFFPLYMPSVGAGPNNTTRGVKKVLVDSNGVFSLHLINVTRYKDKKRPVDDLR